MLFILNHRTVNQHSPYDIELSEYRTKYESRRAIKRVRRPRVSWMTTADDRILEVLESSGMVLSPRVIAYNADYSRSYVSRRLKKLVTAGMVDKVDDGMYEITEFGRDYLYGELEVEDIDLDDL